MIEHFQAFFSRKTAEEGGYKSNKVNMTEYFQALFARNKGKEGGSESYYYANPTRTAPGGPDPYHHAIIH